MTSEPEDLRPFPTMRDLVDLAMSSRKGHSHTSLTCSYALHRIEELERIVECYRVDLMLARRTIVEHNMHDPLACIFGKR